MTIRQLIHDGPTKANELFAKLAETGDGAVKTRERLLAELKAELELLAGLEEQHLLPVLKKHQETKDLVADIRADNKQIRALLAELEGMPKQGEAFAGKLAELRTVFQQHVRDEKRELLPAVARALSEEEKQAVLERIEAAKAEAEAAQREEAERQRAEVRRERERAQAEEAKRQEVERRRAEAERQKAEAAERRAQQAAERQAAEAAERAAQEAAAAAAGSAEVAVESGLRLVEASSDVAEAGAAAVVRGGRESLDLVADAAQRTAAATSEGIGQQQAAASAAVEAEGELTGLWLELTREQVARNVELLGRLAAARDWREALEVQHGFVRESLDRAGRLNSRYLELVWRALASAGRGGERKKAA
jgi:hypothetical protein